MKSVLKVFFLLVLTAGLSFSQAPSKPSATSGTAAPSPGPPKTRVDSVKEVLHGVEVTDPYRWLEDQEAPETRAWIDEQNRFAKSQLGALPGREALEKRFGALLRIDTISMPTERNGRYFYSRRLANQDLSVQYVRAGLNGKEEVLLDPHPMSPDHTVSISRLAVSRDGSLMAYGIRKGGEDELEVHFLDVATRKDRGEVLPRARYFGFSLKPDNSGLYYTRYRQEGSRVFFHAMNTDPAKDTLIFGEGYGPDKLIGAGLSSDGRYLLIEVAHGAAGDKVDVFVQNVAEKGPIVPVAKDIPARFSGEMGGGTLFLFTNWQAPRGRILAVDPVNPAPERWREIVPESDAVMEGFTLTGGKVLVSYLKNVVSSVKVFDRIGKPLGDLALPSLGSLAGIASEWEKDEAFYSFSSFHTPATIYRYDAAHNQSAEWARLKVPIDSSSVEVKQVWYTSKDKTRIPMFLVHKKGIKLDGSHPTYLTGYGGFTVSLSPFFSAAAVLWAEHGGVYAVPNLRGGGEFGEEWHKAGMLDKKQNVFDDFHAAAEWLIQNKYTSPSKLAISGGSNGGLLVGAAVTQRPELFGAVVCEYPLLDMIRYHKFLVARFWVPEYGSADDPAQFSYLRAYSPYQNVKEGTKYPAVLFITGDSDTRVAPLHARKMAALMQQATGSGKPVLLLYDTKAGHSGGGTPVTKQIENNTDEFSFLFWQLGISNPH